MSHEQEQLEDFTIHGDSFSLDSGMDLLHDNGEHTWCVYSCLYHALTDINAQKVQHRSAVLSFKESCIILTYA